MKGYTVELVQNNDKNVIDMVVNYHYAMRRPSISFAFLIKFKDVAIGAITYGKPASHSLCVGVCGKEYSSLVYELNRVIFIQETPKNLISWALSKTENIMKKDGNFIIVSYSDRGMNHNGYIYQASNYMYTGSTKERTDKYTPNGKHSRWYDEKHNHLRKVRTSKHRYVKFIGSKTFKRRVKKELRYTISDYPKEESGKYILGERMKVKVINKDTGKHFYE